MSAGRTRAVYRRGPEIVTFPCQSYIYSHVSVLNQSFSEPLISQELANSVDVSVVEHNPHVVISVPLGVHDVMESGAHVVVHCVVMVGVMPPTEAFFPLLSGFHVGVYRGYDLWSIQVVHDVVVVASKSVERIS